MQSTAAPKPIPERDEAAPSAFGASNVDFALASLLAACIPLLIAQAKFLWERPHFQFFPLAWLAFVYLVLQRGQVQTTHVRFRARLGIVSTGLALFGLVAAIVLLSPWLAQIAASLAIFAWALLRLGGTPWYLVVSWMLLLAITIPLPRNMDLQMVQGLQALSTESASAVLDTLQVPHLAKGNILEVRGEELFVDQACSGVGGLYALAAVALIMATWNGVSSATSLLVLATVPLWSWLGNTLRLTLIAYALHHYGVDWTHGWQHSLLGILVFGGAVCCLALTNGGITQLLKPFPVETTSTTNTHRLYNRLVVWPAPDKANPRRAKRTEGAQTPVAMPGFMRWILPVALLLGMFSILPAAGLGPWKDSKLLLPTYSQVQVASAFPKDSLPEKLLEFERGEFDQAHRERGSVFGEHSVSWDMRSRKLQLDAQLSLDFPFDGFHGLEVCYTSAGHQVASLGEVEPGINEVHFRTQLGGHAYLCFVEFTGDGQVLPRTPNKGILQRGILELQVPPTAYQLQVFCERQEPFAPEQIKQLQELLQGAFQVLAPQVTQLTSTL